MDKLELECPTCRTLLELDPGFAGGVCRCYSCGTLMTVPAQRRYGRAEKLVRPERPDRPDRPGAAASSPGQAAPTVAGAPETYLTASGRRVRVDAPDAVPVAQRRQRTGVRIATVALVVGALMALTLVTVVLAAVMLRQTAPPPATAPAPRLAGPGPAEPPTYDPAVNLLAGRPGELFGRPLGPSTVVVLDASFLSRAWWTPMQEVVVAAVGRSPEAALQVVAATDLGPMAHPGRMVPIRSAELGKLRTFLAGIAPARINALSEALGRALEAGPRRLIVVTGQRLQAEQVDQWRQRLAGVEVDLTVVLIDTTAPQLQDLVRQRGGHFVALPLSQFDTWYAAEYGPKPRGGQ